MENTEKLISKIQLPDGSLYEIASWTKSLHLNTKRIYLGIAESISFIKLLDTCFSLIKNSKTSISWTFFPFEILVVSCRKIFAKMNLSTLFWNSTLTGVDNSASFINFAFGIILFNCVFSPNNNFLLLNYQKTNQFKIIKSRNSIFHIRTFTSRKQTFKITFFFYINNWRNSFF